MNTAPNLTASQLAGKLGRAPRTMRKALEGVPHSTMLVLNGGEAKAWTWAALPKALREEFDKVAPAKNFRDGLALFDAPAHLDAAQDAKLAALRSLWAATTDDYRTKAVNLQRALLPSLRAYDAGDLAGAELEARGLEDYTRLHGRTVSPRTWRFVFQRTRDRARTPADYDRPELFLDENCARRRELPAALSFDSCFGPLHLMIGGFHDPTTPTPGECEALWSRACEIFHPRATDRRFKRALLDFLWHFAPRLALSKEALRVNLGRKLDAWQSAEHRATALRDGRRTKAGEKLAAPFAQTDLDAIMAFSLFNCGARLAQGVRELRGLGADSKLSGEMLAYLGSEAQASTRGKSYVPTRLRDAVRHELAMLKPHRIGPRAADGESAWLKRDWTAVPSMFAITMDDVTLPVYFWTRDTSGKVILTRGQCLAAVDCRSWRILGFSLQPDRNYNSHVIRTLITRVCSERGLPKIFYFERGIWQSSKLVKGNAVGREMREAGEPFSWPECEHGLTEFGVKFIHAIRPRSKIVERVFGAVQSIMEGEPGNCGREERKDRPEDLAKKMYAVEHGEDPAKHFYSFEQWEERLGELFGKYNAERQCGDVLDGLSPDQAFEKCMDNTNPPEKFGPDCRYLLAHQKVTKVVGNNGVTLSFGKERFTYRDAQTGALRGQTVLCWFDPDAPEHLVITDLHRKNPISVERAAAVLPFDDESEHFRHEIGKAQAHSGHARARYRVLRTGFKESFRRVVPDRAAAELGVKIEQQRAERTTEQRAQESLHRKAARLCEALGLPLGMARDATPESVRGFENMLEVQRTVTEETP